jgi:hypothetical protein
VALQVPPRVPRQRNRDHLFGAEVRVVPQNVSQVKRQAADEVFLERRFEHEHAGPDLNDALEQRRTLDLSPAIQTYGAEIHRFTIYERCNLRSQYLGRPKPGRPAICLSGCHARFPFP